MYVDFWTKVNKTVIVLVRGHDWRFQTVEPFRRPFAKGRHYLSPDFLIERATLPECFLQKPPLAESVARDADQYQLSRRVWNFYIIFAAPYSPYWTCRQGTSRRTPVGPMREGAARERVGDGASIAAATSLQPVRIQTETRGFHKNKPCIAVNFSAIHISSSLVNVKFIQALSTSVSNRSSQRGSRECFR